MSQPPSARPGDAQSRPRDAQARPSDTLLRPTLRDDDERVPCLGARGRAAIRRLREHPDAPNWTYAVGDRLRPSDLEALDALRAALDAAVRDPQPWDWRRPSATVLAALAERLPHVPWLRRHVGDRSLDSDWGELATSSRDDLARDFTAFVPDDVDLEPMLIYRTAGTTGHPIAVPHHARAVAAYLPLIEQTLRGFGLDLAAIAGQDDDPRSPTVAALLLSAQLRTYTYATALSAWGGAGFAKLNLRPTDWRDADAPRRYLEAMAAPLVNGEPLTFAELLALRPEIAPRAMISTSVALAPGLRRRIEAALGTRVIDWYSAVETGPIAARAPDGGDDDDMALLAPDLHVEIVDAEGRPQPPGVEGEIAVSGGRNPYLPLCRYRTGDRATIRLDARGQPRLHGLQGRAPVRFRADDGTPVGSVDVARALREHEGLLCHQLVQGADRGLHLALRPLPACEVDVETVRATLRGLFGALPVQVEFDPALFDQDRLHGRKPRAWISAFDIDGGGP